MNRLKACGDLQASVETVPLAILVVLEDIVTCEDPASDSSSVPTSSLENNYHVLAFLPLLAVARPFGWLPHQGMGPRSFLPDWAPLSR